MPNAEKEGEAHPAALDCLKCPALCCRLAGYVEVTRADIRRLAVYLGLTVRAFEERHIKRTTRKGERLIKEHDRSCQFLGDDHRCTVYEARPRDCRGYVCWDQDDTNVYDFARYLQTPVSVLRERDDVEDAAEAAEKAARRKKQKRRK